MAGDFLLKNYLEIGKIVSTHGVKGEVRVQPWCDSPQFMKQFKTLYFDGQGRDAVAVAGCRPHGNVVLLKLQGIDTPETARELRGKVLYMRRADANLSESSYFIQELLDCEVYDAQTGVLYGQIKAVSPTGANDVWHIEKDGREYLLPAIREVVKSVDVAAGKIEICPMRGIFDEAEYAD